jgi:GMP synthase (glutamine-hydrolysing)
MDTIAILDFGGQYTHLIANRIRRLGVYSEIVQSDTSASQCKRFKGIILSGSPHSVLESERPGFDPDVLGLGIPVLGLCYGHQLMAQSLGGTVVAGKYREYGIAQISLAGESPLLKGLDKSEQIWMSHGDAVEVLPKGFSVIGSTSGCVAAAMGNESARLYGLQFHPEVTDTPHGMTILDNFITLCACSRDWNTQAFMREMENEIKKKCGAKKVFLLVSGGVDSTVAFTLLNKVLGEKNVLGLHIDNGLMRHKESGAILDYMKANGFHNLRIVDASETFLAALNNSADPEQKRHIIGTVFIKVQEQALRDCGLNPSEWILGQGTIYPDTIESAGTKHAERIKTHHNRVDAVMALLEKGEIIEPLALLYKDEVRELGVALGLPESLVWRHPFPGPGLGVRVLCSDGENTSVDAATASAAAAIAKSAGYDAIVLPIRSVGVQGDSRTYAHPALVVGPKDWNALEAVSTQITNKVRGVNRVVFGLSLQSGAHYRIVKAFLTKERLELLRALDSVVTTALHTFGEYGSVWQMPVVLLPLVNTQDRQCAVLRPIMSQEAMTARFARLKEETIAYILDEAKKIDGMGDIFYDVTHKPPATIEWE